MHLPTRIQERLPIVTLADLTRRRQKRGLNHNASLLEVDPETDTAGADGGKLRGELAKI
jgi:urease gamma subunit